MTWEQTIEYIRTKEEYKELVKFAYLDADLSKNVELYKTSDEYKEIIKILRKYSPSNCSVLDIGAGNGITSIVFALEGYQVTSVEPDGSNTIGAGAIRKLKKHYNLQNIEIFEDFAENLKFPNDSFDVVFARQAMHHAGNLSKFVAEMARVLKTKGLFFTVRDHIIYNQEDKKWFLENHPLQKYYNGENAYTSHEYKNAIKKAGLKLVKELKYNDSVINYYPAVSQNEELRRILTKKIGKMANIPSILYLYRSYLELKNINLFSEKNIPGRMYSYIALKK